MQLTSSLWAKITAGMIGLSLAVAFLTPSGAYVRLLTGDVLFLVVCIFITILFGVNAIRAFGGTSLFWMLLSLGCLMWCMNAASWTYWEVWRRSSMPDVDPFDVVLFLHMVPIMGAVALRPNWRPEGRIFWIRVIDILLLLIFWVYLYTIVVLTAEFIERDNTVFSHRYDLLYDIEIGLVMIMLAVSWYDAKGPWRVIYRNLFGASTLYLGGATFANMAIRGRYYFSGGLDDAILLTCLCWLGWVALWAREQPLSPEPLTVGPGRWDFAASRLAALAMPAVPVIGAWSLYWDPELPKLHVVRLEATLFTMAAMGLVLFARQYLQERDMVRLLQESQGNLQRLRSLQGQLVQKEKLASVGLLAAGAAHEINNPTAAIMGYAELMESRSDLPPEAQNWAKKIRQQAVRTSELVAGLLRFARQSPSEKGPVDLARLLRRVVPFFDLQAGPAHERIVLEFPPDLPEVHGSPQQLQQTFVSIMQNAFDAMDGGPGKLWVKAGYDQGMVWLEFVDEGPGIAEPDRVFDPFYTTKPVGKGTGLGLSAAYGVIQDHGGQIAASNHARLGAVITVRLPAEASSRGAWGWQLPPE
jgi:signal transduction histidine kinase